MLPERGKKGTIQPIVAMFLATALLGCAPASTPPRPSAIEPWVATKPIPAADWAGIRAQAMAGRYDELEEKFRQLIVAAEQDPPNERLLIYSYRAFDCKDRDLYAAIDQWVKARPESGVALTARAYCAAEIGWKLRGKKWARDTPPEQMAAMRRAHALALPDAWAATRLNPDDPGPYRIILQLSRNADVRSFYIVAEKALAKFPGSFTIWANVIDSRSPTWGGSREEITQLAQKAQDHATKNPELKTLLGLPFYYEARAASQDERYEDAYALYSKALAYGDNDEALIRRAWVARQIGRFDQARADYTRARTFFPQQGETPLADLLRQIDQEELQRQSSSSKQ